MDTADAAEAFVAQMPVEPPPIVADAVVPPPPPNAADAVETVGAPLPVAPPATPAEAVGTPPPAAEDDAEAAAAAPMPVVPSPLPPPEQKIQSVMNGGEEPLPSEIHKVIEGIEVQVHSLADDWKPCDMTIEKKPEEIVQHSIQKKPEETVQHLVEEQPPMVDSDNYSKESENEVPTQPCPSDEQQKPMVMLGCAGNEESQNISPMSSTMVSLNNHPPSSSNFSDTDGLSDDSPTRNSNDDSDHNDYGLINRCYDPYYRFISDPYYRYFHRRGRRNCGYSCVCNAGRNHWHGDYPCDSDFANPCNPMASRDTEPWSHWSPLEREHGKKRYNVTSADTGRLSRWSSPEPDCWKKRYSVGAGLSNPRWWTCFINCILQCMVHTVPLVLKLREADHPDPCPRAAIGFCCFCSLKLHVDESIRLSGSAFYPESFVNHLKSISSNFESGVQQDAQEFLCDLLEKLDEASVVPRSSSEEPSSTEEEGGIAKEIFRGRLKSQLRCPECKHCSDKSEPFLDLSLEVTMVESLMDALQSFTKVELIEDFMCDGCKSRVNMEKHLKVEQAPEVLVIHLKRFTNSGGKIWDKVKYPLELDINSFMSSSDNTPQKYDLYGVVVHLGIYGRGHYICYIRSSADDWYEFNDDKICRYSEASVLDSTAYLLFYVKQGSSPWFSTLLEKEDRFPLDGEQGTSEVALVNNKEEESSSHGQDNSGYCLVGPAEENGNGPSLPDISQDIQQNGNGNTMSDAADKLEEGCFLGGMSGGTQELSCLTGSGDENCHVDGFLEPWESEDVSPKGSLDTKEINPSTHGLSEVDPAVTQGGLPPKRENICSFLESSHKYGDNCHCRNFSLQEDETGDCSGAPSMGLCTSENETVESKSNHKFRDSTDGAIGWEEATSEKRKRPSSADADGGDCESKASVKRRKLRDVARYFDLCRRRVWARRRAWAAAGGKMEQE